MSRLDQLYRSLLLTKFFTKGWGNPENLKRLFEFRKILSCRETCQHLVSSDYPIHIDKDEVHRECRIVEGHFISPFTKHLPGIMPEETEIARFQAILPKTWEGKLKPVCLHLAGTGDHHFWRRRTLLARPLLKEAGIASIILENPFYGVRKPKQQIRSSLHNVSDLFVMGGALVLESLALFHWCERQGYGPLGITGISMGGHMASVAATNWHKPLSLIPILSWSTASCIFTEMASLAATNWSKPIVLVPCLSWSTASVVFTQGVLSGAIPWKLLQEQYFSDSSYEDEIAKLIHSPEKNRSNSAFQLGRDFARNYPVSVSDMEKLQSERLTAPDDAIAEPRPPSTEADNRPNVAAAAVGKLGQQNPPHVASYHTSSLENLISRSSRSYSVKTTSNSILDRVLPPLNIWGWGQSHNQGQQQEQVIDFMRGIMDECTHLGNFSVPVDTGLVIIVAARSDAYVPRESVLGLHELWPGAEVRYIDSGHISAFLFKQGEFRKAIIDAFNKQIDRYY